MSAFNSDVYILGHAWLDDKEITQTELYDLYCFDISFQNISWSSLLFDLDSGRRFDMLHDFYVVKKKIHGLQTSAHTTFVGLEGLPVSISESSFCRHDKKYINKISNALKFWYCPDCKKDLGDA
jgi:hypothetical protein